MTGALSDDRTTRLRERLGRLQASHPLVDALQRNVSSQALKYGTLDSTAAASVVRSKLQDLELWSTRDEQVRWAIRVLVSVSSSADGRSKSSVKKP